MRLWKGLLLWTGQLVVLVGFAQAVIFLFEVEDDVRKWLASNRELTAFALVCYFVLFALYYFASGDADKLRERASAIDEELDNDRE